MSKRNKRIFRRIKRTAFQFAVYLFMIFLAIVAVSVVLSLPEIIGLLIFG